MRAKGPSQIPSVVLCVGEPPMLIPSQNCFGGVLHSFYFAVVKVCCFAGTEVIYSLSPNQHILGGCLLVAPCVTMLELMCGQMGPVGLLGWGQAGCSHSVLCPDVEELLRYLMSNGHGTSRGWGKSQGHFKCQVWVIWHLWVATQHGGMLMLGKSSSTQMQVGLPLLLAAGHEGEAAAVLHLLQEHILGCSWEFCQESRHSPVPDTRH